MSHIRPKNLRSIGIAPRWDITYIDAILRDRTLLNMNEIKSPRLATNMPPLHLACQADARID